MCDPLIAQSLAGGLRVLAGCTGSGVLVDQVAVVLSSLV
jgi:hypothetical protein